jgi:hypothetical protein
MPRYAGGDGFSVGLDEGTIVAPETSDFAARQVAALSVRMQVK